MEFSEDIKKLLADRYPDKDIYKMSLEELKSFKEEIENLREEYSLIEIANKTVSNAMYGSMAVSKGFYFYNLALAGDITGECRALTKWMWDRMEKFFHEDIWGRKDLWKKYNFALDESKHDWMREQVISTYSDTDSSSETSEVHLSNETLTMKDLFDKCKATNIIEYAKSGHELVKCPYKILNWTNDNKLYFADANRIVRRKVNKSKFKIKTKSGKEIIVTGDHSCVVFRNGEQLTIKAKDINPKTDKILSVLYSKFTYQFEEIESVEQLEDFKDEYVYDIEMADDSHTFIANDILLHNSVYVVFGGLFKCMTPEYQELYKDDNDKLKWVVNFAKDFMDKQNKEWLDAMYNPRGGKNVHEFELETVSHGIFVKKKKYLKAVLYNKGKFLDHYKMSGTGIEIIKSTTPKICRTMLKDLLEDLLFNSGKMTTDEYVFYFNNMLAQKKKEFYAAPIEDISQSVGVGAYKKYVIDDKEDLVFTKRTPVSVKAIARYNHLAHKNGEGDKRVTGGKIKYYNITLGNKAGNTDYFGFPSGELPSWAPPVDKAIQWRKNIIDPINRFLEVMKIPLVNGSGTIQLDLFGF